MKTERQLHRLARLRADAPEPCTPCLTRGQLEAFQLNRLPDAAREAAESHLSTCTRCVDELLCLDVELPSMSSKTLERVLEQTEPMHKAHRRTPQRWVFGSLAVAAALMIAVVNSSRVEHSVPPYEVALLGETRLNRGLGETAAMRGEASRQSGAPLQAEPAELPVFLPGNVLTLSAQPARGLPSELPVAAAYVLRGTEFVPIEPAPDMVTDAKTGLIELAVPVGTLLGKDFGPHTVRMLLLPEGRNPPKRLEAHGESIKGSVVVDKTFEYRSSL